MTAVMIPRPGRSTFQRIQLRSAMTATATTEHSTSGYIAHPPWRMRSTTFSDSSMSSSSVISTVRAVALDADVELRVRAARLDLDVDVSGRPVVDDQRRHAGV